MHYYVQLPQWVWLIQPIRLVKIEAPPAEVALHQMLLGSLCDKAHIDRCVDINRGVSRYDLISM
jgi:hypothetical protein